MKRYLFIFISLIILFGGWRSGSIPINFIKDGANFVFTGPVGRPSLFASDTNTLWFSWEGYQSAARVVEATTFKCLKSDCTTGGTWTPRVIAGTRVLANPGDVHGVPASTRDPVTGITYIFYGSHASDLHYTQTTNANDPSTWTDTGTLSQATYGVITFPRPFVVGSTLYLFYTTRGLPDNITGNEAALAVATASIGAGGALTWSGTFTRLVNVTTASPQHDGWIYPGSGNVTGTKINFVFSYGLTIGMFPLSNIYNINYDTVTGNVISFDGSTVTVPASQPVSKAILDSSYTIYSSNNLPNSTSPDMVVDDAGATHVVDIDATSGTSTLFEINNSGSGWSSPHTIYSFTAAQTNLVTYGEVTKAANGGIGVYFFDAAFNDSSFAIGSGNLLLAIRASNGTWATNTTILTTSTYGYNNAEKIQNGPTGARVVFTEVSNDGTTIVGNLRGFAYSDSTGFLRRQNFLLKRDIDPAANDNTPMFLNKAA